MFIFSNNYKYGLWLIYKWKILKGPPNLYKAEEQRARGFVSITNTTADLTRYPGSQSSLFPLWHMHTGTLGQHILLANPPYTCSSPYAASCTFTESQCFVPTLITSCSCYNGIIKLFTIWWNISAKREELLYLRKITTMFCKDLIKMNHKKIRTNWVWTELDFGRLRKQLFISKKYSTLRLLCVLNFCS